MSQKLNRTDNRIQLKRGVAANINIDVTKNQALEGEPHWATDTDRLYIFDGTQNLGIPMLDTSDQLILDITAADKINLTVKAAASQTANLTEWQDSSGAVHHAISLPGATDPHTYFNKQLGDSDTIIAGDTEPNLLRVDAGTDTVRMGDWDTNYTEIDNAGDVVFVGGAGLAFGEIYAYDTNATITISGTGIANKVQVTVFAVNGVSNNTTPDHTTDDITITKAGKYLCTVSISALSTGGSAYEAGFGIYKNNGTTLFQNLHAHRNLSGGGGDTGSMSLSGIVDLAVNDTIELWVWNEDNTNNIILDDATLSLVQIGG